MNSTPPKKELDYRFLFLTGARLFGLIFSLAIPMILGRQLDVETYGTYKQILFVFWLSQIAFNFGFDDSVYYYFKIDPKNFSLYGLNALLVNLGLSTVIALLMIFFKETIGSLLNNMQLVQYIPLLGLLIILTVSSLQIEGYLLNLNKVNARLFLDTGTELLKSIAILTAFIFFNSIYLVLIFLSLIMFFRMLWAIKIIFEHKKKEQVYWTSANSLFKKQFQFALPLGVSRIIQNLLNLETLFISSFFNLRQYTFYSVGCFENPIINSVRASLYELVNIELLENIKENNYEKAVLTWQNLVRKVYLLALPITIYFMFFSKEFIIFIFSDKYLESVPYFTVFNILILVGALNPEPLFRATSQTSYALKIRLVGVLLGLLAMIASAIYLGPMYVLYCKILTVFFINWTGLVTAAQLIKSSVFKIIPWLALFKITLLSIFLAFLIKLGTYFLLPSQQSSYFWTLAISFSVYSISFLVLAAQVKILKQDELLKIKQLLKSISGKFGFRG